MINSKKLSIQEVNALNRFINSPRTSEKTREAFKNVLEKYKPTKEELNKKEIEDLEDLLNLISDEEDKLKIQEEINKLKN